MSILNNTRINFYGGYSTNVCTTNNNDIVNFVNPVTASLYPEYAVLSDKQIQEDLIKPVIPQTGGSSKIPEASWNYYGDMTTIFEGVKVSSAGKPGAVKTDTALSGLAVNLLGVPNSRSAPMMIDTDPTGTSGTQIYLGGIQLGLGEDSLIIPFDTRCYSYFVGSRFMPDNAPPGFTSAGAIWQFSIPKSAIPNTVTGKPELDAFLVEARLNQGIVMRFAIFELKPGIINDALITELQQGARPTNPALGYAIGTLGIWEEGELESSPSGRILEPSKSVESSFNTGTFDIVAPDDATTAFVSLDLVNSLPKAAARPDIQNISQLGPNADIGELNLTVDKCMIGALPYNPLDYFKFGGIYDVPLNSAQKTSLETNPLQIVSDQGFDVSDVSAGAPIFTETPYRIQSDQRCNYLDSSGSIRASIRVTYLGAPVPDDTPLYFKTSQSGKLPDPHNTNVSGSIQTSNSEVYKSAKSVLAGTTDIEIEVNATNKGGLSLLNIGHTPKTQSNLFLNFRVYPNDDYTTEIAKGPVTWEFVYDEVLRYYYLTYPAMSLRIPLNDPNTIRVTASAFLQRIEDSMSSPLFMPPTREMSPGKRHLLQTYLKQVQ